jgi:hypothetical protein
VTHVAGYLLIRIVAGKKPCVSCPSEVKCKGVSWVGGTRDKDACTVHPTNIVSQLQHFVARCLGKCFWFTFYMRYSSTCKIVTWEKRTVSSDY